MIKDFDQFQAMGKDSFEASVASATALTKGFQDIATEVADYSRKSFEESTAVVEKAFAAKSFDKALEVQSDFAKVAYEAYVGQMTKIGEMYMNTAKEAYKPFEGQIAQFAPKAPKEDCLNSRPVRPGMRKRPGAQRAGPFFVGFGRNPRIGKGAQCLRIRMPRGFPCPLGFCKKMTICPNGDARGRRVAVIALND